MKKTAMTLLPSLLLLAACGGAGGPGGKNGAAAKACDAYAKGQLGEKTYALDLSMLAASMKDAADGTMTLEAPITIEPGLASEMKESLHCTVRFAEGKDEPDVINLQFIW